MTQTQSSSSSIRRQSREVPRCTFPWKKSAARKNSISKRSAAANRPRTQYRHYNHNLYSEKSQYHDYRDREKYSEDFPDLLHIASTIGAPSRVSTPHTNDTHTQYASLARAAGVYTPDPRATLLLTPPHAAGPPPLPSKGSAPPLSINTSVHQSPHVSREPPSVSKNPRRCIVSLAYSASFNDLLPLLLGPRVVRRRTSHMLTISPSHTFLYTYSSATVDRLSEDLQDSI